MAKVSEKATSEDYRALGVQPGAQPAEVKHAFRNLVKRWHPDRYHQRSALEQHQAEERFKAISLAYRRIAAGWDSELKKSRTSQAASGASPSSAASPPRPPAGEHPDSSPRRPRAADRSGPTWLQKVRRLPAACLKSLAAAPRRALLILGALLLVVNLVPWERLSVPTGPNGSTRLPEPKASSPAWPTQGQPEETVADGHASEETDQAIASLSERARRAPPGRRPPLSSNGTAFSIGSTLDEVLQVQGPPDRVRGQTWIYGLSDVSFKDGKVSRYNNFGGELRVHLAPSRPPSNSSSEWFALGASADEVLSIQGTPTRVEGSKWFYGFSEVSFKNGRVDGFDNYFGALKVRMLPSGELLQGESASAFTIGSTMDEVLTIQGTPTSIRGNVWFYGFSNVLFRNGKVQNAVDTAGVLRFVLPEEKPRRK